MNWREQIPELLEQTANKKVESTEDISRERGVEIQLRMWERGLLQNTDLWLRPTDLSWHFPILMTIREEPFKNYRSRTSEKWKAKFEEAKKQMIKKNDDGRSNAN